MHRAQYAHVLLALAILFLVAFGSAEATIVSSARITAEANADCIDWSPDQPARECAASVGGRTDAVKGECALLDEIPTCKAETYIDPITKKVTYVELPARLKKTNFRNAALQVVAPSAPEQPANSPLYPAQYILPDGTAQPPSAANVSTQFTSALAEPTSFVDKVTSTVRSGFEAFTDFFNIGPSQAANTPARNDTIQTPSAQSVTGFQDANAPLLQVAENKSQPPQSGAPDLFTITASVFDSTQVSSKVAGGSHYNTELFSSSYLPLGTVVAVCNIKTNNCFYGAVGETTRSTPSRRLIGITRKVAQAIGVSSGEVAVREIGSIQGDTPTNMVTAALTVAIEMNNGRVFPEAKRLVEDVARADRLIRRKASEIARRISVKNSYDLINPYPRADQTQMETRGDVNYILKALNIPMFEEPQKGQKLWKGGDATNVGLVTGDTLQKLALVHFIFSRTSYIVSVTEEGHSTRHGTRENPGSAIDLRYAPARIAYLAQAELEKKLNPGSDEAQEYRASLGAAYAYASKIFCELNGAQSTSCKAGYGMYQNYGAHIDSVGGVWDGTVDARASVPDAVEGSATDKAAPKYISPPVKISNTDLQMIYDFYRTGVATDLTTYQVADIVRRANYGGLLMPRVTQHDLDVAAITTGTSGDQSPVKKGFESVTLDTSTKIKPAKPGEAPVRTVPQFEPTPTQAEYTVPGDAYSVNAGKRWAYYALVDQENVVKQRIAEMGNTGGADIAQRTLQNIKAEEAALANGTPSGTTEDAMARWRQKVVGGDASLLLDCGTDAMFGLADELLAGSKLRARGQNATAGDWAQAGASLVGGTVAGIAGSIVKGLKTTSEFAGIRLNVGVLKPPPTDQLLCGVDTVYCVTRPSACDKPE
jgi:hypothetical protein